MLVFLAYMALGTVMNVVFMSHAGASFWFIRFGRWSSSSGRWLVWQRIYLRGRWTPFVRVWRRYHPYDRIQSLRSLVEVQGQSGNWNCNPYMHGLYNGMEFALSIMEGREPQYRNAPEKWLSDLNKDEKPVEQTEKG